MALNHDVTWVLISNASGARLFGVPSRHRPWVLRREYLHPSSRSKGSELLSDRPGRTQESARPGVNTIFEPHLSPKEAEARNFARILTEDLERGRNDNQYQRLAIVAPPHFLGLLRERLSPQLMSLVALTLDKDYTHVPDQELPAKLIELSAPASTQGEGLVL